MFAQQQTKLLEPLKKSELSVATSIAQVRQLVQDDSEETSRIVEIERLAKVKMDFVNQVLVADQTSPAAAQCAYCYGAGQAHNGCYPPTNCSNRVSPISFAR